jgi:hypothetical protein
VRACADGAGSVAPPSAPLRNGHAVYGVRRAQRERGSGTGGALRVAQEQHLAHRCARPMTPPPSPETPRRGTASRPPHLPLADLEAILCAVSEMLVRVPEAAAGKAALDARVVQCHSAIAACRRHEFSAPLLRALSAKVLEVETDALVLRRTLRFPERELDTTETAPRAKRARKARRRRD